MKSRDERVALMNEVLGAIRMLKVSLLILLLYSSLTISIQFMAWERSFEKRVLKIRDRELFYQWRNYVIEVISRLVMEFPLLTPPLDTLQRDLATFSDPDHCDRILALYSHPRKASYACHCLHFCTQFPANFFIFDRL